jgi:hypothetical protein
MLNASYFIEVARLDQIPPGARSQFAAAGEDVALFNVDAPAAEAAPAPLAAVTPKPEGVAKPD